MSDARRTFCPEDGRACYTPKGPEPEGFRCANYELCKSFERPANPPKERTDPVERFMAAIGSEAMQQPGEGLVFSYGQVERGIRTALQSSVVTEGMIERLANTVANIRQGESSTPRCEPPGEFEVGLAREWVRRVLKALAMSAKAMGGE